jgi:hypothetical protein
MHSEPLSESGELSTPDKIALSTGGCVCLLAYWVFSSTLFDAAHSQPEMHIFPEHFAVLEKFLQDDAHSQIQRSVGTMEALLALGLWLQSNNLISANPTSPLTNPTTSPEDSASDFMRYIHLITLIALYDPQLQARNAASVLAGLVLHSDPSDDDRLKILEDLLENCMYANLKARAVVWLREELISASAALSTSGASTPRQQSQQQQQQQPQNLFATPQALETVQYVVFPSLDSLLDLPTPDLVEFVVANMPFLMQAVNFALFLWGSSSGDRNSETTSSSRWRHVLPANMEAAVEERWVKPLREVVERVERERKSGEFGQEAVPVDMGILEGDLSLLRERISRLEAAGAGGVKAGA